MALTSRERVLAAIRHEKPDRTPMDFGGSMMSQSHPAVLRRFRDLLGFKLPEDRDADGEWVDESIQQYLGVDLRLVHSNPPLAQLCEIDEEEYERVSAETKRRRAEARTEIKNPAVGHEFPMASWTLEDVKSLKPSPPAPPRYLDWSISLARDYREAGYATTYWVSGGFFEQGCYARGYDRFAMDLVENLDLVRALFDVWLEEKLAQVEHTVKPLAPFIDIFCFGDDWGLQTGPFMSPNTFKEIIKPYFDIHYGKVHDAAPSSYVFHHSCGSVYRLLETIIDMGVDVLNPIQPGAAEMGAGKLKETCRGRLCFHGGIDLQHLLPFGTPEEVRQNVAKRKAILDEGGGYICAPAHSLPEDVPAENIIAMFED
jgi:uroporphyrinogen decarboxylase